MKLLIINYEFPPLGSGAANATMHLCRELSRRGHEVCVLTTLFHRLARCEQREGFRIERIAALRRRLDRCEPDELVSFALRCIPAALGLARSMRPDVVLAFFAFPGGPPAWAVQRALGVPFILSMRNADVPRPELGQHPLLRLALEPLVRWLWRRADGLVAVSAGLRDEMLKLDPGLDVETIPNGVDTETFHPAQEPPAGPGGAFRLLYVGRLRPFKGLQDLLTALAEGRSRIGRPLRLEIVGDGPYRSALEQRAAALGLQEAVTFRGRLPSERMPEIYRRADLLVLPSHAEGMPNVVLEALASGLPSLVTDIAGSRELVRNGVEGAVVPPGDPPALTQAIIELAAHSERLAACAGAARARAMEFSWARVADEYLSALARAARKSGGRRCAASAA